jgi:nitroreductase
MEFQEVVRKRRMVRDLLSTPIPRETIERIFANAQRGPSSGYTQGFEFLIFDRPESTSSFWENVANPTAKQAESAPLIIVPLAHSKAYVRRYLEPDRVDVGRKSEEDWPTPYWFIDAAFASMLILLTAVDSGLGAFYFSIGPTSDHIPRFRRAFGIPDEYYPIGAIAVGYRRGSSNPSLAPDLKSRTRRPRSEVMHFGKW